MRVGPVLAGVEFRAAARGALENSFLRDQALSEAALVRLALLETPFDRLARLVQRSGGPTPRLALRAFSLIGGRGPGVPAPPRDPGQVHGTQALWWVLQAYSQLSPQQQRAVDAYLAAVFPQGQAQPTGTAAAMTAPLPAHIAASTGAEYQAIADDELNELQRHLPALGRPVRVFKSSAPGPARALAMTEPEAPICRIAVFPLADGLGRADQEQTIAHELGHCYQGKFYGDQFRDKPLEHWLTEGLPEWMADVAASAGSLGRDTVSDWHLTANTPLNQLSFGYVGAGFFGHVADVAGDGDLGESILFSRVPQIMTHKTLADGALGAVVGADGPDVYDGWGSSLTQRADLGRPWTRISPFATGPLTFVFETARVEPGAMHVDAPRAAGNPVKITAKTPFLRIQRSGGGGPVFGLFVDDFHFAFSARQIPAPLFCTVRNCNTCPAGTVGKPPPTRRLHMPLWAGLSGGDDVGGAIVLTGEPWSKYCKRKRPPKRCPLRRGPRTSATCEQVYSLRIPWPHSEFPGPLLSIRSCKGLRGPWRGTLNLGPTTAQKPREISFTAPTTLMGTATGTRPNPGGIEGEVHKLTLSWVIPVRVSSGPPATMSFPQASRDLVTAIQTPDAPDQIVDTGNVRFTYLASRAWPLRTGSGACA